MVLNKFVKKLTLLVEKCNNKSRLQVNLNQKSKLLTGNVPFPDDDRFKCPSCKFQHNVSDIRSQVEAQTKQRVV